MVKIYFKILALSIPAISAVVICCHVFSDNFIDYYYAKITNEGQSLIIGTSRASQGIIPDSVMRNTQFDGPMLNFALSSFDSPFGDAYYNAIKKKLNKDTKNGLFIIEIEASALLKDENSNLKSNKLDNQIIFHGEPNCEYIFRNVNPFYKIIEDRHFRDKNSIQHANGWIEVVLPLDSNSINLRRKTKLQQAKEFSIKNKLSAERIDYLKKTIRLLQSHGKVMLIKIPAWQPIQDVENTYLPHFNQIVQQIAKEMDVKYYDFSQYCNNYSYTDGNHLDKRSTIKFSSELNKIILKNERTNIH